MKRTISGLVVIVCQVLIVGFFFTNVFSKNNQLETYVSTIHNENLDKIATSVSLLFKEEEIIPFEETEDELILEELPAIKIEEKTSESTEEEEESVPLVSVDADKYNSVESMGFVVTEGNKQYQLTGYEFDVVVAVVAGEFDKNKDDALAVVSVILNRCDSAKWSKWAGVSPYSQVIRAGQFEIYFSGAYLAYMPGGRSYGGQKYNIAKQAVIDGINGIRNNKYLGFRAWHVSSYSNKYIVYGGNRYGYN